MTEQVTGRGERSVLGREEALWAEIIRCEVDSWRPRRLPARFRPGAPARQAPAWGSLPFVVAVCLIVLTVATFANVSTGVGGVLHQLGGIRPLPVPGSNSGEPPASHHGQKPATGSGGVASSARTSKATGAPSPHIARAGTASEPRTAAPSPSAQAPAPLPSLPPPPAMVPSPVVVLPIPTPVSSDPPAGLSASQRQTVGGYPVPSAGQ
jgi:hypothetical protein